MITGGSQIRFAVSGLDASVPDELVIEFYGSQMSGSYDLASSPDDNYGSCVHCLLVYEDAGTGTETAFFPAQGTMNITIPDSALDGQSNGGLLSVLLEEVTISGFSTPVPGGRCLVIASANWDTT
jgi:hypothetical protein